MIVVYNTTSGDGLDEASLRQLFMKHHIKVEKIYRLDEAEKALGSYLKKPTEIAVIGGDGTISAASQWIADSPAIMVPLPGGTLNHFTKDLGIPQDIEEAIALIKKGKSHKIDVATVNNRIFINNSSVGLYPSSLHVRARFEEQLGKWPAAVIGTLRTFVRLRTYDVTVAGEHFRTPFIFVGNNEYRFEGGSVVRKKIDGGKLSVLMAKTVSRRKLLQIVVLAIFGRAHTLDDFDVRTLESMTIHARKRQLSVALDGEVTKLTTPLHYEVRPHSLNIFF